MLKLPKDIPAGPEQDALQALFANPPLPLWEKGAHRVVTLPLAIPFSIELRHALGASLATQGLEQISKELANEQKGLDALAAKTPTAAQAPRISRLLFLANDGSERFYRECDALLTRYPQRLLACKLDASGEALGEALYSGPKLVRAILVTDKKAAARILLSLVRNTTP